MKRRAEERQYAKGKRGEREGERVGGSRGMEWAVAEDCRKLKRGQIEINSRVTKPRLKY